MCALRLDEQNPNCGVELLYHYSYCQTCADVAIATAGVHMAIAPGHSELAYKEDIHRGPVGAGGSSSSSSGGAAAAAAPPLVAAADVSVSVVASVGPATGGSAAGAKKVPSSKKKGAITCLAVYTCVSCGLRHQNKSVRESGTERVQ